MSSLEQTVNQPSIEVTVELQVDDGGPRDLLAHADNYRHLGSLDIDLDQIEFLVRQGVQELASSKQKGTGRGSLDRRCRAENAAGTEVKFGGMSRIRE